MIRGQMVEGRWHEEVRAALPDGECVFSSGNEDYQGSVDIIARLDDGRWLHYGWSYGSCSGCDQWEDAPAGALEEDVRKGAAIMDAPTFGDYLVACLASRAGWLDSRGRDKHTGLAVEQLVALVGAAS